MQIGKKNDNIIAQELANLLIQWYNFAQKDVKHRKHQWI